MNKYKKSKEFNDLIISWKDDAKSVRLGTEIASGIGSGSEHLQMITYV